MFWITDLKNKERDEAAFVVGNGVSKTFYDMDELSQKGIIIACNYAYKDHVADYLCYRDPLTLVPCTTEFKGPKITLFIENYMKSLDIKGLDVDPLEVARAYRDNIKSVFFFKFLSESFSFHERVHLVNGSTGLIALQVAYILGCNPIILVGCDCARVKEDQSSNVHHDDSKVEMTGTHNRWKKQFNHMARMIKSYGREVYKLGDYGSLDIPVMEFKDI